MNYWRVTKYNPFYRDDQGRYKEDTWTSIGDIGKSYKGVELTTEEYKVIENTYAAAVVTVMEELEIKTLRIKDLEISDFIIYDGISDCKSECFYKTVQDGKEVSIEDIPDLVKLILREILWAKLESDDLCVHFGYDFYMYFIAGKEPKESAENIIKSGLFIENIKSPYLETD